MHAYLCRSSQYKWTKGSSMLFLHLWHLKSTDRRMEYVSVPCRTFVNQVNVILHILQKEMFEADMQTALVRLEDTAKQYRSNQPRSFYNDLHISPLMVCFRLLLSVLPSSIFCIFFFQIHLSFSQGGTTGEGSSGAMPIQSEFFKVLFQSVGVSVTELQDVVFKYEFSSSYAYSYFLRSFPTPDLRISSENVCSTDLIN